METAVVRLIEMFFNGRPIWPSPLLFLTLCDDVDFPQQLANANFKITLQRRLLPLVADRAPGTQRMKAWRLMWIRKGFDPCTNPDARRYQIIDFRCNNEQTRGIPVAPTSLGASSEHDGSLGSKSEESLLMREYLRSVIGFSMPPLKCQFFYCFYDIKQKMIRRTIDNAVLQPLSSDNQVLNSFGWFTKDLYDQLRAQMKHYLQDLAGKYDRKYSSKNSAVDGAEPVQPDALQVEGFSLFE